MPAAAQGQRVQLRACVAQPGGIEVRCGASGRTLVAQSPCSVALAKQLVLVRVVKRLAKNVRRHKAGPAKLRLKRKLEEGKITRLANAPELDVQVIDRSAHIVGMAGIEPFVEALENGAEVVIAGRSSDTSIFSAMPVMRGINPASVWHAAKILECGAACVVTRKYPDCNFAIVRDDHFIVEPPNPDYRCDPELVELLVENSLPTLQWMRGHGVLSGAL